jgi:hypothetical protein
MFSVLGTGPYSFAYNQPKNLFLFTNIVMSYKISSQAVGAYSDFF